jgi:hypothetical protein
MSPVAFYLGVMHLISLFLLIFTDLGDVVSGKWADIAAGSLLELILTHCHMSVGP